MIAPSVAEHAALTRAKSDPEDARVMAIWTGIEACKVKQGPAGPEECPFGTDEAELIAAFRRGVEMWRRLDQRKAPRSPIPPARGSFVMLSAPPEDDEEDDDE